MGGWVKRSSRQRSFYRFSCAHDTFPKSGSMWRPRLGLEGREFGLQSNESGVILSWGDEIRNAIVTGVSGPSVPDE